MLKFYFVALCSAIVVAGCDHQWPDYQQDPQDFIPEEKKADQSQLPNEKTEQDFSFLANNFPDKCDWLPQQRVVDGDTVIVGDGIRVRLVGIDTPETKHPTRPIEPFGLEASAYLSELLVAQDTLCLLNDPAGDEYDRYGRRLAYLLTREGLDINVAMLKAGLARGLFSFPFSRRAEFEFYQNQAKSQKIGLWEQ